MATTLAERQLTEAHRIAQVHLGAQTIAHMRTIWPLLDPKNLDGTFDQWLSVALPIIQGQRHVSAQMSAAYLATYKTLTAPDAPALNPVLADEADHGGVTTSLLVTGPISVKQAMSRGVLLDAAADVAMAASAAAAMRWVLDGGRDTIVQTVKADPQATGFERVTSDKPCAYCESLAGEVFTGDSADVFPCHDGCACSAEPVFLGT